VTIQTIERLVGELLAKPTQPLSSGQKERAYDFAAGLFAGHVGALRCESPLALTEIQALRALAHKQSFYFDYFVMSEEGRADAKLMGAQDANTIEAIRSHLLDIEAMNRLPPEDRKAIATRSSNWARARLVAQLAQDPSTDAAFVLPARIGINYSPDVLLKKAANIRAYRDFYHKTETLIAAEPDARLAAAERVILALHVGRLHSMAAVDVFPGLLSLENQLTYSKSSTHTAGWAAELARVAPAIGAIHQLGGDERIAARDAYARHLDAIRQGAPFELDVVDEKEATFFTQQTFDELLGSLEVFSATTEVAPTQLGYELERVRWGADAIKQFVEAILARWGMLSVQAVIWEQVDQRGGFAVDGKFQVVITPYRKNMSVDSVRRVINVPADIDRPLAGLYPAGALPLIAHELTHVLQAYADYELGQHIPLARIKGRRYRILREAGGVYQEYMLARDYFGMVREPNNHYVRAYQAKAAGKNRAQVARAFYDSLTAGASLSAKDDAAAHELAANRTARLYRYGGHASQALDYVEQSVVCDVLLQRMEPEQVGVFLLGGSSFNLEDSAALHQFGLFSLPDGPVLSPAKEVMNLFLDERAGAVTVTTSDPQ